MEPLPAGRDASSGVGVPPYVRHRLERTLLYQLVRDYYPAFKAHLAAQGSTLPPYIEHEFDDYLKCGRLEQGDPMMTTFGLCRQRHGHGGGWPRNGG